MTHAELCRLTAERFVKKTWLALWEYQSYASAEFPDVLTFSGSGTALYEIKMSRADFLADAKKDARRKWKPKGYWSRYGDEPAVWMPQRPELYYIQKPHLGTIRYFVCEAGLIKPEELPEGWGLYWYADGKFTKKRESKKWRPDVHTERDLAAHALRRYASGDSKGIIVRAYGEEKADA